MRVISEWLSDPVGSLQSLITLLPAILPALVLHEMAHGWIAWRLGDPTAKMMGRLSFNPLKHLDPLGTLFLIIVGLGWARPVPVNPRYFKNPRRDDFLVSIAGITANLIMFVVGCALMYGMVFIALRAVPESMWRDANGFIMNTDDGYRYYVSRAEAVRYAYSMREYLIEPYLGTVWGYVFEIFVRFAIVNVSLAVFNLLPVPPLDGYHVVNDLLVRRALFAPRRVAQIGQALLLILAFTGWLGKGLSWAINGLFSGIGRLVLAVAGL